MESSKQLEIEARRHAIVACSHYPQAVPNRRWHRLSLAQSPPQRFRFGQLPCKSIRGCHLSRTLEPYTVFVIIEVEASKCIGHCCVVLFRKCEKVRMNTEDIRERKYRPRRSIERDLPCVLVPYVWVAQCASEETALRFAPH